MYTAAKPCYRCCEAGQAASHRTRPPDDGDLPKAAGLHDCLASLLSDGNERGKVVGGIGRKDPARPPLVARMSARTTSNARSNGASRSGSCSNPGSYPQASRNARTADAGRVPSPSVTLASANSRAPACGGRYSSSFTVTSNAACRSTAAPLFTAMYSASRCHPSAYHAPGGRAGTAMATPGIPPCQAAAAQPRTAAPARFAAHAALDARRPSAEAFQYAELPHVPRVFSFRLLKSFHVLL